MRFALPTGRKLQTLLATIVIVLVFLSIIVKVFYNYQAKKLKWTEEDKQNMIETCISNAQHLAVRFPDVTEEYCICRTDSIIANFKKIEYLEIESKSIDDQGEKLLPVIRDCFNNWQNAMFERSELD